MSVICKFSQDGPSVHHLATQLHGWSHTSFNTMVKLMLLWRKNGNRGKRLSEEDHCRVELFMWHLGCKINTSKWPHLISIVFLVKCVFSMCNFCVYTLV